MTWADRDPLTICHWWAYWSGHGGWGQCVPRLWQLAEVLITLLDMFARVWFLIVSSPAMEPLGSKQLGWESTPPGQRAHQSSYIIPSRHPAAWLSKGQEREPFEVFILKTFKHIGNHLPVRELSNSLGSTHGWCFISNCSTSGVKRACSSCLESMAKVNGEPLISDLLGLNKWSTVAVGTGSTLWCLRQFSVFPWSSRWV